MSDWLNALAAALGNDFQDFSDLGTLTRAPLRLAVAAFLGGWLGRDRERAGKAAGRRTHMLVALGSALFILVPEQAGVSDGDLTRVIQGLVAGIGFLGAGAIIKSESEGKIHGLTTAASIWLTAAIGMTVGMGKLATATISTACAWVILAVLAHIEPMPAAPNEHAEHANAVPAPNKTPSSHAD